MEKGKDYDKNFSPTPVIAIVRIITSIAAANDLELHAGEGRHAEDINVSAHVDDCLIACK